jgi:CHAT domain-containing protein/tetratricopeptide (TPR) repeat protein
LQVKVDGEEAILSLKPQNLREVVTLGSGERGPFDTSHYILEPTADQWRVAQKVLELAHARDWKALFAMAGDAIQTAGELREANYLESDDSMILGVDLQSCSGAIYNHVANSYQQLGECAKAIELFERALAIFKERGNRSDEAATYHGIGMCYQSLGEQSDCLFAGYDQYDKAIELFQQAFAIKEREGSQQGATCFCLGNCYRSIGEYAKAIDLFEQCLAASLFNKTALLDAIASCRTEERSGAATAAQHRKMKEVMELWGAQNWPALSAMADKASNLRDLRDEDLRGPKIVMTIAIYNAFGVSYQSLGDYGKAMETYEQVLTIVEGYPNCDFTVKKTKILTQIASCLASQRSALLKDGERVALKVTELHDAKNWLALSDMAGDALHTARELRETSLLQVKKMPSHETEAVAATYEPMSAEAFVEKYARDLRGLRDVFHGFAYSIYFSLGVCYTELNLHAKAIELFKQAVAILDEEDGSFREKQKDPCYSRGEIYNCIGTCYSSLQQYANAIEVFKQGLSISKEVGNSAGQARIYFGLGQCYEHIGQYPKAIEMHNQSLSLFEDDRVALGKVYYKLGSCYYNLDYAKMRSYTCYTSIDEQGGVQSGLKSLEQGAHHDDAKEKEEIALNFDETLTFLQRAADILKKAGGRMQSTIFTEQWEVVHPSDLLPARAGALLKERWLCGVGYFHVEEDTSDPAVIFFELIGQYAKAIAMQEQALAIFEEIGDRGNQAHVYNGLGICYRSSGQYAKAIELFQEALSINKELGRHAPQSGDNSGLGNCYFCLGQYPEAIEHFRQSLVICEEVGDRSGQGRAYHNLGNAFSSTGDATAAAQCLVRAILIRQDVEQEVGVHDDRRLSVFEGQQRTYMMLQRLLLECQGGEAAGWALGVAAEAKARALAYHLGAGGGGDGDDGGDQLVDHSSEHMCGTWWAEVQRLARAEGAVTRVLEYSFLFENAVQDGTLAIWVLSGATGELLCSKVVPSTGLGGRRMRTINQVLVEARSSMKVWGRDVMRDARNHRGRLLSYLLKRGHEYSRWLQSCEVSKRGQNISSETAPARSTRCLPGLFAELPTEISDKIFSQVLPQLDFTSLMNFLCSCKSFRDLEVMHPLLAEARSFIVKTALQQINILDAIKLDLEMILSPARIRDWLRDNDGSELVEEGYIDFCKQHGVLQYTALYPIQDDHPQTGTSFWEYLEREPPAHDNDGKLEWFTRMVESELEEIRDEVLDRFRKLPEPPADHLEVQTRQVCAELIRNRYASLNCSRTDGSSFSFFDQLQHEVAQRHEAAVDLHRQLQDFDQTLLFHSILRELHKGDLDCVEHWIWQYAKSAGAHARNERSKSGKAEREEVIREIQAWALGMLQSLRVGGGLGYANNILHVAQSDSVHVAVASERGKVKKTWEMIRREQQAEEMARETSLLKELYQVLIAPVEAELKGAKELLIVPHKELYEVPWAALTDANGGYLIERHVIRTTPSLRVARKAADKIQQHVKHPPPHVVLVGNPLPTRLKSLPFAEKEVKDIEDILKRAGVDVHKQHYFRSDRNPPATKANVKRSLEGADWAHMALHGDLETDSLVLAMSKDSADQASDLSMHEVQGSEGEQGVRLAQGATVVLSACNTGRGEIKAEGVVGIARGFLLANASATVVSLWSVDDGSTGALMRIKYKHLTEGGTVPQALRLAMLRLARRSDPLAVSHKEACDLEAEDVADGLQEEWKRPMHWAGFLVVGAATRLPLPEAVSWPLY